MKRLVLTFVLIVFAVPAFARERAVRPVAGHHRAVVPTFIASEVHADWLAVEKLLHDMMYRINDPRSLRCASQ